MRLLSLCSLATEHEEIPYQVMSCFSGSHNFAAVNSGLSLFCRLISAMLYCGTRLRRAVLVLPMYSSRLM